MIKMLKKITILLIFSIISANSFAENQISEIRIGESNQKTRIVFEAPVGDTISIRNVFYLQSPPRLVIDMPSTKISTDLKKLNIDSRSNIKEVREGKFDTNTHRIVIDLKDEVTYSYFSLGRSGKVGPRLVVDIKPKGYTKYKHVVTVAKNKAGKTSDSMISINPKDMKSSSKKDFIIMIDPGHGGRDPGAVSRHNGRRVFEKDITLSVAQELQKELNKHKNIKAYLTRTKDEALPLRTRIRRAERKNADLFISVHADSHKNKNVRGGSVYVLSERSSDKEAARLARIANQGDEVAGVILKDEARDIQSILIDLTQRESMNKSALLAQDVLKEMRNIVYVKDTKAKFAGFVVLKSADIPSILVETSYISNYKDRKILLSKSKQNQLAEKIAYGVKNYINKNY